MSNKILIVDFDDSFTFNIASTVFKREPKCIVINHKEFFDSLKNQVCLNEKMAIILGPGPGHPDQYRQYLPQIKWLLDQDNIFVMGICLGHQIIGRIMGHEVKSVTNQLHGVAVDFEFKGKTLKVQRYNSLGVFDGVRENIVLNWPRGVSYQFHPESIGTENNLDFFEDLLQFIGK